jgi:flagellar basal-body rod protein FlgB
MPAIESLTLPSLSLALDAAVMRHQAIASNIANVHTVGYVPQHLTFEAEMSRVSQDSAGSTGRSAAEAQPMTLNVRMEPVAIADEAAGAVHLDREVAAMAQNSMHYQTLLRGLNRHLALLTSAVTEGKR